MGAVEKKFQNKRTQKNNAVFMPVFHAKKDLHLIAYLKGKHTRKCQLVRRCSHCESNTDTRKRCLTSQF